MTPVQFQVLLDSLRMDRQRTEELLLAMSKRLERAEQQLEVLRMDASKLNGAIEALGANVDKLIAMQQAGAAAVDKQAQDALDAAAGNVDAINAKVTAVVGS